MNKILWIGFALTLQLLVALHSSAGTIVAVCNSCDESRKLQLIMEDFEANPSNHHYLVKDLDSGVLQKYNVMYEPEIGQGIPNEITPTSSEESSFLDEAARWESIRHYSFEPYKTGFNVTAYDLARYNFLHKDLVQDFEDNSYIGREVQAVVASLLSVSARGISINSGSFTFDVELSDGGLATLQFTGFKNVIGNSEYQVLKVTDDDEYEEQ